MALHLIVGSGSVGRQVARLLAENGEQAVLTNRSGQGPSLPGVRRIALDATDPEATARAAEDAAVIYNCLNPAKYHRWPQEWPPMANSLLRAAESSGAGLATTSNLYAYGRETAHMTEDQADTPTETKGRVRARMWADALAAHREGRIRALEVRSSDYMGDVPPTTAAIPRVVGPALAGKAVRVVGSADQPHTWTDVVDVAALLVAAAADPTAWGRVWHTPSNPPRTQREAVADVCAAAGRPAVDVRAYADRTLAALSLVVPALGAVRAMSYQFEQPFVMDSTRTQQHFGLAPRPWDEVCAATARVGLRTAA